MDWKGDIIRAAQPHRPAEPFSTPMRLDLCVFLPRPQSLRRKKDPDGPVWAPKKPDRDNLDKAVLDALTADGWFSDDCLVVFGVLAKVYHRKGGVPGAIIRIARANAIDLDAVTRRQP